jgi:hypothetical protein
MSKLISRRFLLPIIAFCFLDLLAIGAGMGVPIFAILLGFVVGWFIPRIFLRDTSNLRELLKKCLLASFLTSCLTLFMMIIIWGPTTRMLLDPSADLANFGMPLILFDPRASFIGWIGLMIVISPILQVLATAFASSMHLAWQTPTFLEKPINPVQSEKTD